MSSKITLNDKNLLKESFKRLALPLSEYSFANCYLFQKIHRYEIRDNFISGVTRDGFEFLLPLVFPFDIVAGKQFFPIPEEFLSIFTDEAFEKVALPRDFDYIFSREKMSSYPGRSLAGQRNFVRQIQKRCGYLNLSLDIQDKPAYRDILSGWNQDRNEETDYESCLEAIEKMEELDLIGAMVRCDKEPIGFLIGETLLPDMVVIHFAKAKPNIKGIYQFMYQDFCKQLPPEIKWINLEQDLGIPGLIQAKSSYVPDKLLKKYRVIKKGRI